MQGGVIVVVAVVAVLEALLEVESLYGLLESQSTDVTVPIRKPVVQSS